MARAPGKSTRGALITATALAVAGLAVVLGFGPATGPGTGAPSPAPDDQTGAGPATFAEAGCAAELRAEARRRWPGGSYDLTDPDQKAAHGEARRAGNDGGNVRVGLGSDEEAALEFASGELGGEAMRRWPRSFAGTWGEQPRSDRTYIAFTEGAEEKVAKLVRTERYPCPELVHAETFEHSFAGLEARMNAIGADRELAHDGELELPGVPGGQFDMGLDEARNAIVVTLEDVSTEAVGTFHARYGEDVVVEEGKLMRLEGG